MLQRCSAVVCFFFLMLGSFVNAQEIPCITSATYYAFSGGKGFPLKYDIHDGFIEVKEMRKDKDELLNTYKIAKVVKCNFRNPANSNLIFKINSYDQVSDSYGDKESEIEINIMEGKGKIFVRQPGLPEMANRATATAPRR